MPRCRHGFELSMVACPVGCGGKTAQLQSLKRIHGAEPEPLRYPGRKVTADEIADALASAPSVRHAREKLGISEASLLKHVRASAKLRQLYDDAKARGMQASRERYGWRRV